MEIITFETRQQKYEFIFERMNNVLKLINNTELSKSEINFYIRLYNKYIDDIERMNPLVRIEKLKLYKFPLSY